MKYLNNLIEESYSLFTRMKSGVRTAIYSLIANCKLSEIDPFEYLRDVLGRVSTHPARPVKLPN
jgi:hypothetical protein